MSSKISYYSTNRYLENVSGIEPFRKNVSFRDALIIGQAPDEGTISCRASFLRYRWMISFL